MDCKNEIYVKNWIRSTWIAKVNPGKSQRSTFQKLKSTLKESTAWGQSQAGDDVSDDASWWCQCDMVEMTLVNDVTMMWQDDVSRRVKA